MDEFRKKVEVRRCRKWGGSSNQKLRLRGSFTEEVAAARKCRRSRVTPSFTLVLDGSSHSGTTLSRPEEV